MSNVRARVSFFAARKDGGEDFVGHGQEVDETEEVVKAHPENFEPVEGEAKPAKKAAAKKATAKKAE